MGCKVSDGIDNSCADLLKGSGLSKRFWVGYIDDLDTRISTAQSADIGTLDFGSYGGLYRFETGKFASDYTWNLVTATGGNKSFDHLFNTKLLPGSTAEDLTLQKLLLGDDIFIVAETLNEEFFILGAQNGLTGSEGSGGSGGKDTGGDISDIITLKGNEKTKPLRFSLGGGYQATLDYLTNFEL